jgi:hypothetical protein
MMDRDAFLESHCWSGQDPGPYFFLWTAAPAPQVHGDFASWLAEACQIGCVIQARIITVCD